MQTSALIRRGGLAAVVGSAVGILVAPFMATAYAFTEQGAGLQPFWGLAMHRLMTPLFDFAGPEVVYAAYGKTFFLVFLGVLLGFVALRAQRRELGRSGRWGLRLAIAGAALNLVGNVADYWIQFGNAVDGAGFVLGTMVGTLLLVVGSTLLGVALLRTRSRSVGSFLLVATVPANIVLALAGFVNIPAGPALSFSLPWAFLGYALWSGEAAAQPVARPGVGIAPAAPVQALPAAEAEAVAPPHAPEVD